MAKTKGQSKKSSPNRKFQRWVVKAGSNMICSGGPLLIRSWMNQVSQLKKKYKIEVIWVTSGAIASAVERTGFQKKSRLLAEKQALSAIGQPMMMDLYNIALQATGCLGAQVLLSYGDLKDPDRLNNFKQTIEKLLEWDVVPVLNENDAVATDEIKFGDNDALSSYVAHLLDADRLVILTDVEGLFETDPRKNPDAALISSLKKVTPALLSQTEPSSGTVRGTGGMYSKLKAAQYANTYGISTHLARGDLNSVLVQIATGQRVGTQIGLGGHDAKS